MQVECTEFEKGAQKTQWSELKRNGWYGMPRMVNSILSSTKSRSFLVWYGMVWNGMVWYGMVWMDGTFATYGQ